MEIENFKAQQQDRADEGKELKREDDVKDVSQIPKKDLPETESKSLLTKLSEGISHIASTIGDKVGFKDITVEGHEDLDKDVKKQVKKINKEILQQPNRESQGPEKIPEWAHSLTRHELEKSGTEGVKGQAEGLVNKISGAVDEIKDSGDLSSKTTITPNREGPSSLDKVNEQYSEVASKVEETLKTDTAPKEGTSLLGKVQQGIHNVSERISQGVGSLKPSLGEKKAEEREDDGTKEFRKVKDGFNESVDELKREQRLEELGQEQLSSNNPFQTLSSGNKDETENRTLGEKVREGINDSTSKISTKIGEVSQKVRSTFEHKEKAPQDKENLQQIS